jgi:hypothetical protein
MACLLAQATRHLAALRIPALQLLHREFQSYRTPNWDVRALFQRRIKSVLRIPEDPYVFGPPGSVSQRKESGFFYHQAKIVRKTLIPTVL